LIGSGLVDRVQLSPNIEARFNSAIPRYIILHYTGMASGRAAVDWLCNPVSKVSCHYLVDCDGTIVQMVDEDKRAWHAGVSSWQGEIDINSASIGIEIQNEGHAAGCPAFPLVQMQRVAALCSDIIVRHGFGYDQVLAHSDVAPGRKIDPGEVFDWEWLAGQGIGCSVVAPEGRGEALRDGDVGVRVGDLQQGLASFGYGLEVTGQFDDRTRIVVEAFQRRFRRSQVDGIADVQTCSVLRRLLAMMPQVTV
jgi:N-acetylmuramoyl-L-alanine amidase